MRSLLALTLAIVTTTCFAEPTRSRYVELSSREAKKLVGTSFRFALADPAPFRYGFSGQTQRLASGGMGVLPAYSVAQAMERSAGRGFIQQHEIKDPADELSRRLREMARDRYAGAATASSTLVVVGTDSWSLIDTRFRYTAKVEIGVRGAHSMARGWCRYASDPKRDQPSAADGGTELRNAAFVRNQSALAVASCAAQFDEKLFTPPRGRQSR